VTLAELIATMPGEATATDAEVLAWLEESVAVPRTVSTHEVREYLSTQINGTGLTQRSALDAIREYAESGTVAGASAGETASGARRSGARMILELLRYGGDNVFRVDDANVAAQFTSLGPDGGNGPAVLTGAQLTAIAALSSGTAPRWQASGIKAGEVTIAHVAEARA